MVYFSTVLQALMRRQDAVIVKLEALQKRVESLMSRSSAASAMTTSSKTNNKKRDVKLPKVDYFYTPRMMLGRCNDHVVKTLCIEPRILGSGM